MLCLRDQRVASALQVSFKSLLIQMKILLIDRCVHRCVGLQVREKREVLRG